MCVGGVDRGHDLLDNPPYLNKGSHFLPAADRLKMVPTDLIYCCYANEH